MHDPFYRLNTNALSPEQAQAIVDDAMIRRAYELALNSNDPSTQNGAVIVHNGYNIVASGWNCFPNGVSEAIDSRWERPLKYSYIEHAERNAIFDAVRQGVNTSGAVMYCPWFACSDCARAIIQAGIKEVVGHNITTTDTTHTRWDDSIKVALDMLEEAGVSMRYIDGNLGISIRRNGVLITV